MSISQARRLRWLIPTLVAISLAPSAAATQLTINTFVSFNNPGNNPAQTFLTQSLDNVASIKTLPPGVTVNVYQYQLFGNVLLGQFTTDANGNIQGMIDSSAFGPFDLVFEIPLVTNLAITEPPLSFAPITYSTGVFSNVAGSFSTPISMTQSAGDAVLGAANTVREIYFEDKWIHDRIPTYVSRDQITANIDPSSVGSYFSSPSFLFAVFGFNGSITFGKPEMFLREAVYHEYAHAVMFATFGNTMPPSSYGGAHGLTTATDPGFAWKEGWADFMMDAVANNPQFVGNPTSAMTLASNTFWRGSFDPTASGVGHNGEVVEGAVASVLWAITFSATDFSTLWAAFAQTHPQSFRDFWTAYMARSPTVNKQAFRRTCLPFRTS